MGKKKMIKENEMYKPLKRSLEVHGFTVAAEVQLCDVVAYKDGETRAIELKNTLNLKVIEQAYRHVGTANRVYVGVTMPKYNEMSKNSFAIKVLQKFNIGLYYIGYDSFLGMKVIEALTPEYNEITKRPLHAAITEANMLAIGGSKSGDTITPYKLTMQRVKAFLEENPRSTAKEIIENVETHYKGKTPHNTLANELRMRYNHSWCKVDYRGRTPLFSVKE